jgi:hypothetical protein
MTHGPSVHRYRPLACALAIMGMMVGRGIDAESARWWRSRRVVAVLDLSPHQVARIDKAYQQGVSELLVADHKARMAKVNLERVLASDAAEAVGSPAVLAATEAAAASERVRSRMLERIHKELTPTQQQSCLWLRACM